MNKKDRQEAKKAFDKATRELNKMYKRPADNPIVGSADEKIKVGERVSTGYANLDKSLGGGLPLGCIVELYGPEGSGKGVLSMKIVSEAQKAGLVSMWVDAENQLNKEWMSTNGVDVGNSDNLKIMSCDAGETAEEVMETVLRTVNSGYLSVVVVDSVAALIPSTEMSRTVGDRKVGALATVMSDGLRKIQAACRGNGCTCIFINQTRDNVGVMYGNPETTPGGKSLKFYSSIRLRISSSSQAAMKITKDGEEIGKKSKVKTIKNRFNKPGEESLIDIYFIEHTPNALDMLAEASKILKVTKKANRMFKFDDLKAETLGELMETIEFQDRTKEFAEKVQEALVVNLDYSMDKIVRECMDSMLDGTFNLEDYRDM